MGLLATYPLVRKYKALLLDNLEKETTNKQMEAISELARQVRHDYKSPLMAIKSVIDKAKGLKPLEQKTLSIAYNKMISMLGDLSQESIKATLDNRANENKEKGLTHIYSSILNVIQEKEARIENNPNINIQISCSNDDKRAYTSIDDIELQRVISNIVENSIESIQGSGEIYIEVKVNGSVLKMEIIDNGKGVPEYILERIGEKGYSFDKKNGEGLGIYSAIKKIESWDGNLKIHSNEGFGTKVTIQLPNAVKPEWACSKIDLKEIEDIIVLDDDKSIHQIWDEKLKEETTATIHKFTNAQELLKNINSFNKKSLFLLDYELRGQKETGLNVAEKLNRNNLCFLVSNSFQCLEIQKKCKKLGVKLLPKPVIHTQGSIYAQN